MDNARKKQSRKRGGGLACHDVDDVALSSPQVSKELLALDEALEKLGQTEKQAAELVKLHYFAGLTAEERRQ